MGDHEHSADVRRPPEEGSGYLADVSRLEQTLADLERVLDGSGTDRTG